VLIWSVVRFARQFPAEPDAARIGAAQFGTDILSVRWVPWRRINTEHVDGAAVLDESQHLELHRRSTLREIRSSGIHSFSDLADLAQHLMLRTGPLVVRLEVGSRRGDPVP
jgi:hypothetical protein